MGLRRLTEGGAIQGYCRLMGRHDPDPRPRLRYMLTAVVVLVVIVLVVVGLSALRALT
jgi:hypothetical protein